MKTKFLVFLLSCFLLSACLSSKIELPPTPTSPPPTATVTKTAHPYSLQAIKIPEQIALRGEKFLPLNLYGYLIYRRLSPDQMTWTLTQGNYLKSNVENGILSITEMDGEWYGSDELQVKVCESPETCVEQKILFSRRNEDPSAYTRVTYVGNSGFMIEAGGKKVLIDALFGEFGDYSLPEYELDTLLTAKPPFDNVNLVLTSHDHSDHFSAERVSQFLENSPSTIFISTSQAVNQIHGFDTRIEALDPRDNIPVETEVNGIQIKAMYLSHGEVPVGSEETFNNGYLVTMGGITLFHTGDISNLREFLPFQLVEIPLNFAFIPHFFMYYQSDIRILENDIGARYLFPIHYKFTTPEMNLPTILSNIPNAIGFQGEIERWTMPSE